MVHVAKIPKREMFLLWLKKFPPTLLMYIMGAVSSTLLAIFSKAEGFALAVFIGGIAMFTIVSLAGLVAYTIYFVKYPNASTFEPWG